MSGLRNLLGARGAAGEARRQAGFIRARVPGDERGATASGLKLGGAETAVDAVWWVAAEAHVNALVGECDGWGERARANTNEVCLQLHAKQFHAVAGRFWSGGRAMCA